MFSRASSSIRTNSRLLQRTCRHQGRKEQRRNMGGGDHWMEVSEIHKNAGEFAGFITWLWVFHRARLDGPVVLGWRHPWEHAEDPWAGYKVEEEHVENIDELKQEWENFVVKAMDPSEDDDDEDEDDEDEDEDDDDDE